MILRPHCAGAASGVVPAWQAVEATQKSDEEAFGYITQPEHAVLAGDLVARFTEAPFPTPSEDIVRGIAWHDRGWSDFDFPYTTLVSPERRASGRPRSFLAMSVEQFLVAWTRSIEDCAGASAAAGAMVSDHFARLARYRMAHVRDTGDDTRRVEAFLHAERERQNDLVRQAGCSREELGALTDLLQFCDLLSLYLCCGAKEDVEFPQKFDGRAVRLRRQGGAYVLDPSPFAQGADLGINEWKYPAQPGPQPLAFLFR